MSSLVILTAKFYDRTGRRLVNLNVQSRYKGSSRANNQKTDSNGLFIFQASPDRIVEILVKPPNVENYIVFKSVNSSIQSSASSPIEVRLPKALEEYQQKATPQSADGTVTTLFKIVDSQGKVMSNFPVRSRPKGKTQSYERYTNKQGVVEVRSSSNRDIEILVLTSSDQFVLKSSVNSGGGALQPILIKLDEPYAKFRSTTTLKLLDRDGSDFVVQKTKVEMYLVESDQKQVLSISNGKMPLISMVGQQLRFTVFKPDGKALQPKDFFAKRVKENPVELHLDVDVTHGATAKNEPNTNRNVDPKMPITMEQMKQMWDSNKATIPIILPILDELNSDLIGYKLDTPLRKAHFMAQVFQEVGPKFLLKEEIEYYGPGVLSKFSYYKKHPGEAQIDGFKKGGPPANGKTIANKIYDDKYRAVGFKLGNTSPGDGSKYIGRGLKQLTGKFNYQDLTDMYSTIWPGENLNFITNPELLEQPKYAVRSGIRFWLKFKLYEIADKGSDAKNVDAITKVINEKTDSYGARRSNFVKAQNIF